MGIMNAEQLGQREEHLDSVCDLDGVAELRKALLRIALG